MKSASKIRLDCLLVENGMFESREKAQRAVLAGSVYVNGQKVDKPGTQLKRDSVLEARQQERYVSRGGLKLEKALQHFGIHPDGLTALDVGASTGGFTDCLLQHGAKRVYAYDVGHDQLNWKIRSDPRVVVRENFNVRHLTCADLPEPVSLCVIDVSFIALTLILPVVCNVVSECALAKNDLVTQLTVLTLIKPQFELERADIGRGGVVRDPALHERAVEKVRAFCAENLPSWRWIGVTESPILGAAGNKEFLACLQK